MSKPTFFALIALLLAVSLSSPAQSAPGSAAYSAANAGISASDGNRNR